MTPRAEASPARPAPDSRTGAGPVRAPSSRVDRVRALEVDAPGAAAGSTGTSPVPAAGADAVAFWSACPRRRLDWRDVDDGRCVVLRPRLGESRAGRWLAVRLGNPCYRIRLDDVGTFIWKACDGETSLATISGRLRDAFGDRVEPAEERLTRFVRAMLRSRMIEL